MKTTDEYREYLSRKLIAQRPEAQRANNYYMGKQSLQFIDPEIARVMEGRIQNLNVNFARLVVDVLESRLQVTGFASRPGAAADKELWQLWQASNMDEQSQQAHLDALIYGRAFFLGWVDEIGSPVITAESPLQCAIHRDPRSGKTLAALKRWTDDDGYAHALTFTQTEIVEFISRSKLDMDPLMGVTPLSVTDSYQVLQRQDNPLGVVPMVALVNRPRLQFPDGESELTDVIPLLDAIGKLSSDMMISAEYSASPRRYVTGLFPNDSANEAQVDEIASRIKERWERAHASKFLVAPSEKTQFGQFESSSLSNYEGAITMLTAQIAAISALPPSYLSLLNSNPTSADAIRSSEARLTAKAERRMQTWSGAYEELMRLAVTIRDGEPNPDLMDLQTLWESASPSTIAQTADAESKLYAAGIIDRRAALSALDYSPQEIDRILQSPITEGAIA